MNLSFTLTDELIRSFAEVTGDFSSIHIDPQFARKSRYRRPVAHGLLAVSFLGWIEKLLAEGPLKIENLKVKFLQPLFSGQCYSLQLSSEKNNDGKLSFVARFKQAKESTLVLEITGGYRHKVGEAFKTKGEETPQSFLSTKLKEEAHSLENIGSQQARLPFTFGGAQINSLELLTLSALDKVIEGEGNFSDQIAYTAVLSTLIGMQLPGRPATFTGFEIDFLEDLTPGEHVLLAQVDKVTAPSRRIELSFQYKCGEKVLAKGKAHSLVNKELAREVLCEELKKNAMDLGISGKVALVVGASRGIGEVTAKLLALNGAKTIVHYYRGESEAKAIVSDITQNAGVAIALQADIRDAKSVANLFANVEKEFGPVDILVNCSVNDFLPKNTLDLTWDDYLSELEVSLLGAHALCKNAIPAMKLKRNGKIIHVSSIVTDAPVSGQNKYITAKSALEGYTKSLAVELMPFGVQVNMVVPGMTETSLLATLPDALLKKISEEKPTGRLLFPEEVAQSILFLASKWSDAVSGQRLVINRGEGPYL